MKTVVVGGQARDVGKTAAIEAVIRAFPQLAWTAVKITQFGDDESERYGPGASLVRQDQAGRETDTARFLAAGAQHAFWLRVPEGRLSEAMGEFRRAAEGSGRLIVESNQIVHFVPVDACLMVIHSMREFKPSAAGLLLRADVLLVRTLGLEGRPLPDTEAIRKKIVVPFAAGEPLPAPAADFLRQRLLETA